MQEFDGALLNLHNATWEEDLSSHHDLGAHEEVQKNYDDLSSHHDMGVDEEILEVEMDKNQGDEKCTNKNQKKIWSLERIAAGEESVESSQLVKSLPQASNPRAAGNSMQLRGQDITKATTDEEPMDEDEKEPEGSDTREGTLLMEIRNELTVTWSQRTKHQDAVVEDDGSGKSGLMQYDPSHDGGVENACLGDDREKVEASESEVSTRVGKIHLQEENPDAASQMGQPMGQVEVGPDAVSHMGQLKRQDQRQVTYYGGEPDQEEVPDAASYTGQLTSQDKYQATYDDGEPD